MSERHTDPELLAARLDRVLPPGQTFTPPPTRDPLVNMAAYIAKTPVPSLSPEAVERIEAQMMSAFDRLHPRVIRRQSFNVWRWAAAACVAFVLFTGGVTASAAWSVPGDPLYGVKQLIEQVELGVAFSPAAKASVYLNHAERRAQEALVLLSRDESPSSLLAAARANLAAARDSVSGEPVGAAESAAISARVGRLAEVVNRVEAAESAPNEPDSTLPIPSEATPTVIIATNTPSPTPSPTNTPTSTATSTPTPSRTPTATPTSTNTITPRPTATNTVPPPTTAPLQPPTSAPAGGDPPPAQGGDPQPPPDNPAVNPAPDCPGNSCNSAGVPGGQIDPDNPPGQSGGRNNNPPDPPGQGNPGGGKP